MKKTSNKQKINYLKGLLSRSGYDYNTKSFLKILEKLDNENSSQNINNAMKIIDSHKRSEGCYFRVEIEPKELEEILFGKNKDEALYQFIGRIYGEKAEQLLRESKKKLKDIHTFTIFKKEIIDKITQLGIKLKDIIELKITSEEMLDNFVTLNKLKENYKDNLEISNVLEKINIDEDSTNMIISAKKLLSNKRVAQNINAQVLGSIIENDDNAYKNICELVGKTYGKEAEEILRERLQIKMRDIPNFNIFDENIRDMIGYGGVHTFLTYYMNSESIITQIANNPEMVRYYKSFEKLTESYFPPSAVGLEERLIAFYANRDLIKQIVDSENENDYKENLLLYLEDKENLYALSSKDRKIFGSASTFFPEKDLKIENLEELEKYKGIRESVLKRYWEEDKCYKKTLIQFKYFGFLPNEISNTKDMKKFLNDYVKFNQTNITDEELDLIELFLIFNDIKDESVLEDLDKLLSQRKDVITPLNIRTINCKIAENYKKEYLDSLISVEKARKMAEESEAILDSKNGSIQRNEASENLSRRYILKNNDDNVYYSDHMKTPDGVKKYRDCIVTQKDDVTTYTFMYRGKNGEKLLKQVIRGKNPNGEISEKVLYKMGDIGFCIDNGDINSRYSQGNQESLEKFMQTYEEMIDEAELIPQYNPEEKFKLEEGDVEGFHLHGIHSNELCVTLIRQGVRPTSQYFNYGGLDRLQ